VTALQAPMRVIATQLALSDIAALYGPCRAAVGMIWAALLCRSAGRRHVSHPAIFSQEPGVAEGHDHRQLLTTRTDDDLTSRGVAKPRQVSTSEALNRSEALKGRSPDELKATPLRLKQATKVAQPGAERSFLCCFAWEELQWAIFYFVEDGSLELLSSEVIQDDVTEYMGHWSCCFRQREAR
jgi:hypothetical protein